MSSIGEMQERVDKIIDSIIYRIATQNISGKEYVKRIKEMYEDVAVIESGFEEGGEEQEVSDEAALYLADEIEKIYTQLSIMVQNQLKSEKAQMSFIKSFSSCLDYIRGAQQDRKGNDFKRHIAKAFGKDVFEKMFPDSYSWEFVGDSPSDGESDIMNCFYLSLSVIDLLDEVRALIILREEGKSFKNIYSVLHKAQNPQLDSAYDYSDASLICAYEFELSDAEIADINAYRMS